MTFLTFQEVFDIIVMTAVVGFIFSDMFKGFSRKEDHDPLKQYSSRFDWQGYKFAIMVTAPAIILHEFGHKLVAMSFGFAAEFNAAYLWLGIGVILKLIGGFVLFVPAYVSYSGAVTDLQNFLIAFSGPAVNLLLWLGAAFALKQKGWVKRKHIHFVALTAKINMFLFIFNMIPIPGFDGSKVVQGLLGVLGF